MTQPVRRENGELTVQIPARAKMEIVYQQTDSAIATPVGGAFILRHYSTISTRSWLNDKAFGSGTKRPEFDALCRRCACL